jgi:hypothetical protein
VLFLHTGGNTVYVKGVDFKHTGLGPLTCRFHEKEVPAKVLLSYCASFMSDSAFLIASVLLVGVLVFFTDIGDIISNG